MSRAGGRPGRLAVSGADEGREPERIIADKHAGRAALVSKGSAGQDQAPPTVDVIFAITSSMEKLAAFWRGG